MIFFVLALLCHFVSLQLAHAQSTTPEDRFEEAMSALDMIPIQNSTGIFYDRVPSYLPLYVFDGTSINDSIRGTGASTLMAYNMLSRAYLADTNSPLLGTDSILHLHQHYEKGDTVMLSAILYQYDRLSETAIDDGLIYYDGQKFQHSEGASASPYLRDTVALLGGLKSSIEAQTVKFMLPADLWTTNLTDVASIAVDFGAGAGFQSILPDEVLTIQYATTDTFRIDMRFTLTNGSHRYASTSLIVKAATNIWDRGFMGSLRTGMGYSDNPDSTFHIGSEGSGVELHIWYNQECMDNKLRKPLILIKGFDPSGTITPSFVMDGGNGLLDGDYDITDENGNPEFLKDLLHETGRDLIFITMDNSTARIQDNAIPTKAAMEWINDQKAINGSSEKNIVIGASMGGLIGKWVLREFELDGEDHETELYITYDSPLRGANIPLALQSIPIVLGQQDILGLDVMDLNEDLKNGFNSVTSPAARQMLYYYIGDCRQGCTEEILSTEHELFYDQFISRGNLDIPHVALTNGSINGDPQLFGPGDQLIDADQLDFAWEFLIHNLLLGIPGLGNDIQLNTEGYALPGFHGETGNVISKFSWQFRKYGILLLSDTEEFTIDPANIINYDHAPGGLRQFEELEEGQTESEQGWLYNSFCFIPTISGLDLPYEDPFADVSNIANTLDDIPHIRSYIGSQDVGMYYGAAQVNMPHISLNNALARFLLSNILQHNLDDDLIIDNRIYNFGYVKYSPDRPIESLASTRRVMDHSLEILNGGQLWINKSGNIAYIDEDNPLSDSDFFDVTIEKATCNSSPVEVVVKDQSTIVIGENSAKTGELILTEETELTLESGSNLIINDESTLTALGGSSLRIMSGAQLTIYGNGLLNIQPDANLIIEKDATILLVSTRSKVNIQGSLILPQGDLSINGMGHIIFSPSSSIDVLQSSKLVLNGHGNENVAFKVNGWNTLQNVPLETNNASFLLMDDINITHNNGISKFTNSKFDGSSSPLFNGSALQGNVVVQGTVLCQNSEFIDATLSINESAGAIITGSDFKVEKKKIAIEGNGLDVISISDNTTIEAEIPTELNSTNEEYTGIKLLNVANVEIRNSTIQNFDQEDPKGLPSSDAYGIYSDTEVKILLHNTFLLNNRYGIYTEQNSLINMLSSEIDNSHRGIKINGSNNEPSLLSMVCSSISNSTVGVDARNLVLDIDALIHSQSTDGEIRPNSFLNNNQHFFIINNQLDFRPLIPASNNTWTNQDAYSIITNGNGSVLNQSPAFSGLPGCIEWLDGPGDPDDPNTYCEFVNIDFPLVGTTSSIQDYSGFCFGLDECNGITELQKKYREGFISIFKTNIDCALDRFTSVAKEKYSTSYDQLGENCQHQIEVANVYSKYIATNITNSIDTINFDIVEGCVTDLEGSTMSEDIIFVLDASSSISIAEWHHMTYSVSNLISSYDGLIDLEYAVTQFSSSGEQTVSIPFTSDPTQASSIPRSFNGGTHVTDGVQHAWDYAQSLGRNPRIVLFTDATQEQAPGFMNYTNQIKASPNFANITVIRYLGESDYSNSSYFAAAASKGGTYFGEIEDNFGDPQGVGGPRQYVDAVFEQTSVSMIMDNISCNTITVDHIDMECSNADYAWTASNGGIILSETEGYGTVSIGGPGTYSVIVTCSNGCEYMESFDIEEDSASDLRQETTSIRVSHIQDKSRYTLDENGRLLSPSEMERIQGLQKKATMSPMITPTITQSIVYLRSQINVNNVRVTDAQGKDYSVNVTQDEIDLTNCPDGILFIILELENGSRSSHKIVKI